MKTIINPQTKVASFDEIIFENRNQNYGAYELRKHYNRYLLLSFLITASIIIGAIIITNFYMNHIASKKAMIIDVTIDIDPPAIEKPVILPPPPPALGNLSKLVSFQVPNVVENPENPNEDLSGFNNDLPTITTVNVNDSIRPFAYNPLPDNDNTEPPYTFVNEPATFQGKDINTFGEWVMNNLRYTEEMSSLHLEGKLTIQFVVNKSGIVEDVEVIRGVYPLIDNEAVRVIKKSPAWKPGKLNGRIVRQRFRMPIVFRLQ